MTAQIRPDSIPGGLDFLETPDIIAFEGLYRLRDSLVLTKFALDNPYNEYWGEGDPKIGKTITIERPYYARAFHSTTGIIDSENTNGFWNRKIDRSITLTISETIGAGLQNAPLDVKFALDAYGQKYVQPVIEKMSDRFEGRVATLASDFYLYAGTPGQAINFMTGHDVNRVASENSIPLNTMNSFAIIGFADRAGVQKEIIYPQGDASGTDILSLYMPQSIMGDAIRREYIGNLANWRTVTSAFLEAYEVQGMASVSGSEPTPLVNSSTPVRGNSVPTDGWPASQKVLRKGQMIEFAGVYQAKKTDDNKPTSKIASFVVLEDVTSDSAGRATIKVYPEIIAGDGSDTMVHLLGDDATYKLQDISAQMQTALGEAIRPFKTVSKAIPDNAGIGIVGMMAPGEAVPAASATDTTAKNPGEGKYARYNQILFLHTDSWAAVPLTIPGPDAAVNSGNYGSFMDDDSGLSISYLESYKDYTNMERLDSLFGVKTVYPELGLRVITERIEGNMDD